MHRTDHSHLYVLVVFTTFYSPSSLNHQTHIFQPVLGHDVRRRRWATKNFGDNWKLCKQILPRSLHSLIRCSTEKCVFFMPVGIHDVDDVLRNDRTVDIPLIEGITTEIHTGQFKSRVWVRISPFWPKKHKAVFEHMANDIYKRLQTHLF